MAAKDKVAGAGDAPATSVDPKRVRVVCERPNAGNLINGTAFAKVSIGDESRHISERIDSATADRFLAVGGYVLFEGNEDEHARKIEDALSAARRELERTNTQTPASDNLQQSLDEQRKTNKKLAAEISVLKQENASLKVQLAQAGKPVSQPAAAANPATTEEQ